MSGLAQTDQTLVIAPALLQLKPADISELLEMLSEGFPYPSLEQFLAWSGMGISETAKYLRVSSSQLGRRRQAGRLKPDESERLLCLAELLAHAVELLQERADAVWWLTSPAFGLGGRIHIEYARTEWGAREVHDLIGRINDGVFS